MKKTVAVSGYFDPLHVGHIEYLEMAAQLGDELIVIVNNDRQAALKKGESFMEEKDRVRIVQALKCVDRAVLSVDEDRTVCESLRSIKPDIFANGGDRLNNNTPEAIFCKENNIEMMWGVGGGKIQSSSIMVTEATQKKRILDNKKFRQQRAI